LSPARFAAPFASSFSSSAAAAAADDGGAPCSFFFDADDHDHEQRKHARPQGGPVFSAPQLRRLVGHLAEWAKYQT